MISTEEVKQCLPSTMKAWDVSWNPMPAKMAYKLIVHAIIDVRDREYTRRFFSQVTIPAEVDEYEVYTQDNTLRAVGERMQQVARAWGEFRLKLPEKYVCVGVWPEKDRHLISRHEGKEIDVGGMWMPTMWYDGEREVTAQMYTGWRLYEVEDVEEPEPPKPPPRRRVTFDGES